MTFGSYTAVIGFCGSDDSLWLLSSYIAVLRFCWNDDGLWLLVVIPLSEGSDAIDDYDN